MKDNNKTMNKTKEEIETLANQIWPSATDGTYNDLTKNFPHYRYGFIQAFEYYTDQIKSMEGQVKELRESNDKWISAIDSRPNTDINCLVYFYNSDIKEGWIETAYFTDDYFYGTVGDNKYITHWRTLPTLPTEDNT